jgi:hypothetical protein
METKIKSPQQLFNHLKKLHPGIYAGGSLILKQYGLISREPKDVDINTNDVEFLKFSKMLSKISPCKNKSYYPNESHFRFNIHGIDVCVFNLEGKEKYNLQQILEAKKIYASKSFTPSGMKHTLDLQHINKFLCDHPKIHELLINSGELTKDFIMLLSIRPTSTDELPF